MTFPQKIQKKVSLAAGATVDLLKDEDANRFMMTTYVSVGILASGDSCKMQVKIDGQDHAVDASPLEGSTYPTFGQFFKLNVPYGAGGLNKIKVRNEHASAARDLYFIFEPHSEPIRIS